MVSRPADTISVNPGKNTLASRNFIDLEPMHLKGVINMHCRAHNEREEFLRFVFGINKAGSGLSAFALLFRTAIGACALMMALTQLSGQSFFLGTLNTSHIWALTGAFCGISLLVGFQTRLASAILFIGMMGLISTGNTSWLPYTGMAATGLLFAIGSGRFSIDRLLCVLICRRNHRNRHTDKISYSAFDRVRY